MAAGGKKAKLDGTGNLVKNAVAKLNEFKPGLAYELVETKGWCPCCIEPQFEGRKYTNCSGMAHAPCYVFKVMVNNQQFKGEGR